MIYIFIDFIYFILNLFRIWFQRWHPTLHMATMCAMVSHNDYQRQNKMSGKICRRRGTCHAALLGGCTKRPLHHCRWLLHSTKAFANHRTHRHLHHHRHNHHWCWILHSSIVNHQNSQNIYSRHENSGLGGFIHFCPYFLPPRYFWLGSKDDQPEFWQNHISNNSLFGRDWHCSGVVLETYLLDGFIW